MLKKTISLLLLWTCFAVLPAAAANKEAYLHFMNGMAEERKGNYDAALQEYRRTIQLDPQEVFVYKQALNLAIHVGKMEEAAGWADYIVKVDSSSAENWVLYGNVKWAKGATEEARLAYELAAGLDPANYEALYQLASLWSSKDQAKSIAYLNRYLALKPEDAPEIYYQIAVLHNMKGPSPEVEKNLLLSKEADSFYLQPRFMLADYYELKGDTTAALAECEGLLALETRNIELLDHVGEIYASPAVSNIPEAEKYFRRAWDLDKTDPTSSFWLSVISENRRDFAAAASYLEGSRALKEDPGIVLRLGYYYTQSGRYLKAVEMLEAAAKKWPDNTEVAYFLALGYDDTGRTEKALQLLKEIIAKVPKYVEARMQYAIICERRNDIAAAEAQFRQLLAADPDNANILNYLGYALADRGLKLEESQGFIAKALSLEPANGAYLDSMAWVQFKRGSLPEARAAILKALKVISDDSVIWEHAGEIYAAAGDSKTAWRAFKTAWLLEKPAKRDRLYSRLKTLQKTIPAAEASALETAYLREFSPAGLEFSAFAKIQAKLRGKTVKFDAILHFSPPDKFNLTVMGPLMMPLWKARAGAAGAELDPVALKDIDPDAFAYWAGLITGELRGWFSGDWLAGGALEKGWQSDCLTGGAGEVCLNTELAWPEKITPLKEKKLKFLPGGYFLKGMYLFAQTLEFKMPFVSVLFTLDRDQMNFSAVNSPELPE
ncbi:MAG TPA: hypothetical protein DCZ92_13195 [Elusimicrobia bacterium]|nr:MAG: hypothetical protein A2016_08785 [Elusimicrobia bacterium GWF2_62_30]HBA61739.1 hypothetical protein [Elusimicrobiota bacterium]